MKDSFRRILKLVRRTGDRIIVTDPDGEEAFVVMDLDDYEVLLHSKEASPDDQDSGPTIHHDSEEEEFPAFPSVDADVPKAHEPDIWDVMAPAGTDAETWDINKLTPQERAAFEEAFEEAGNTKKAETEPNTPQKTPPTQPEDDPGEEQFYLEPVE